MKNNATFHLSSIHLDWRAFFMSLTSIWKEREKNICDEIRCFNKLSHSWFCPKSPCSISSAGVKHRFYIPLLFTDFTNWGDLLSCVRWPLTASSSRSLTSTVIECTTRPSTLFKSQLSNSLNYNFYKPCSLLPGTTCRMSTVSVYQELHLHPAWVNCTADNEHW